MFPSFLLSLREGLEAALIIGIVLGAVRKFNRKDLSLAAWLGAGSAAAISLLVAVILNAVGTALEEPFEQIFEGTTMILAAVLLTWMIFWMQKHARFLKSELEAEIQQATKKKGQMPVFFVAFLAVVREGVELALFLTAIGLTASPGQTLTGSLLGLIGAAILGWLLFSSTVRLDLRRFFQVTSFILIVFAAGLLAHGVHEFNEIGVIPGIIEHVWDVNFLIHEDSTFGLILKALFGYNGNPSLTEVLAYAGYFVTIWLATRRSSAKVEQATAA